MEALSETIMKSKDPKVTYKAENLPPASDGTKHRFVTVTVTDISEKTPYITPSPGDLGLVRIININPQPIGEHFSVVWDGDKINPKIFVDGWYTPTITIRIEAWGK